MKFNVCSKMCGTKLGKGMREGERGGGKKNKREGEKRS